MSDGRIWHVVAYPAGHSLHTAATYEAADAWRVANCLTSVILPQWPDDEDTQR